MLRYSWSGHGNLGDDWLSEIGDLLMPAVAASEKRSYRPPRPGAYRLTGHSDRQEPLILWGGGWLAGDRPGSTTLARWSRHLERHRGLVVAFGIGLGPFDATTGRDRMHREAILARIRGRAWVRTQADLVYAEGLNLGCDPAILDRRFDDRHRPTQSDPYHVISAPRFAAHWSRTRPWLSEEFYRGLILAHATKAHRDGLRVKFLEFDSGAGAFGDYSYWVEQGWELVRPAEINSAAEVMAGATSATTARLHAGILAALVGTPASAISYHHKFMALEELGIPVHVDGSTHCLSAEKADRASIAATRARGTDALLHLRTQSLAPWIAE